MKKTVRDSVFDSTDATGPLCNVAEDHIEVASIRVDKNGIRSMTIEEQVAQLRDRCERAEADRDLRQQSADHYRRRIAALELKVKMLRKRLRSSAKKDRRVR